VLERVKIIASSVSVLSILVIWIAALIETEELNILLNAGTALSAVAAVSTLLMSGVLKRKRQRQQIFVMYTYADETAAEGIAQFLETKGFNPWLASKRLMPGQRVKHAVYRAIEESVVAIFLASENTAYPNLKQEFKAAMALMQTRDHTHSPVLPVLLNESAVIPPGLEDIRAVKFYEENGAEQLVQSLRDYLKPPIDETEIQAI